MKHIVVHYSEIAIKGNNRIFFERKLINNLKKALKEKAKNIQRRYGRIIITLNKNEKSIKNILELIPGISSFSFAAKTPLNMEEIKKESLKILKKEKFSTFKIFCKRSNKDFPLTSNRINNEIGSLIVKKLKKKVDCTNPEKILYIEIGEKEAFIYFEKNKSIGGLPTSTAGKIISSLSGGIDSPVSSFLLMKRGCKIVFVHFFNKTQTNKALLTKLDDIVKQLTKSQLESKLYIIPFEKIQKEIIKNIPSNLRMIIYRRFMIRILNKIAQKEKAKGIVTGDSIGQVASQTLENLNCIYKPSKLPVFSPLIGMNKEEIVRISKEIETYEYSIQPYPDCCSFMISKHPETRANIKDIEKAESFIEKKENLIDEVISKSKIKNF